MWNLAGKSLQSRLLLGTARYPSLDILQQAVHESATQILTVSLQRQMPQVTAGNQFWQCLKDLNCHILPNTAGCQNAQQAVTMARMAREIFQTHWIKVEVIGDDYSLQPDLIELLQACKILVDEGFEVFPYCTDDLVLCRRLLDVGCNILMPGAAPIGTGKGILNIYAANQLRQRLSDATLIIDAGIGKPSHATQIMELGFDGVLLNTAVSLAQQPILMAAAFRDAVQAGRLAYTAGLMLERDTASPSTSLLDTPFWQQVS